MANNIVTLKVTSPERDWLAAQAAREGISTSALVRLLIAAYRLHVESALDPTPQTHTDTEETDMPRPKSGEFNRAAIAPSKKARYTADRPLPPELRVAPPRAVCDVCSTSQWADADGAPKPHLRDAQPGDELYSSDVPTKVTCEGGEL